MFVNRVLRTAARHIALSYSKILPCRDVLIRLSLYRSESPFTFLPWFRAVSLVYPLFTCRISDALHLAFRAVVLIASLDRPSFFSTDRGLSLSNCRSVYMSIYLCVCLCLSKKCV